MLMRHVAAALMLGVALWTVPASAEETIRVAIGTQDTTINCATAGPLIRELKLFEKYLPKTGKYQNAKYELVWKTFTSGPPVTNEMVANKLDIGMMGDFPAVLNGVTFDRSAGGVTSLYVATVSGSVTGGGNGLVVPLDSPAQSLKDLKGKQISVPFGSAAHGMLLRAIKDLGWDPEKDVSLVSQSPEVGGTSLKAKKIDGHADFVPFAELFPFRGFARKVYEGSAVGVPTSHGIIVRSEYAQGLKTALETLKLIKRTEGDFDVDRWVTDRYIRQAAKEMDLDYDKRLRSYAQLQLGGNDALTGKPIADPKLTGQIWVKGETKVRAYGTPDSTLSALKKLEGEKREVRVAFVHDRGTGFKLFADKAWYVTGAKGGVAAFLLRGSAEEWAKGNGGAVVELAAAKQAAR